MARSSAPRVARMPLTRRLMSAGALGVASVILLVPGAMTAASAAPASTVTCCVPAGYMTQFLGDEAPEGWHLAQGQAVSRADNPMLFAAIGTTYGAGDGSTTFNLPDLRGRLPVGQAPSDAAFQALGARGGAKVETLTVDQIPSHGHSASAAAGGAHNHAITVGSAGAHSHTASTGSAGSHIHSSLNTGGTPIGWQNSVKELGGSGFWHGDSAGTNTQTSSAGAHTHSVTVNSGGAHSHSASSASAGEHGHDVTVEATGGGQAHNNLQPYMTVNFIIKAG